MKKEEEKLIHAFKRLIHVLTTGKKTPFEYGKTTLFRAEVHILEAIGKNSGISASDIVDNMEVTKGAVSQIISKLLNKGLIKKTASTDNMKIQELYLTKKGSEVLYFHSEYEKDLMNDVISELKSIKREDVEKFTLIVNSVTEFVKR